MMNKVKKKLRQAWEWTKRNVKKVLVGLGIVTVALAVGGPITTISVNVNGKTIQFKNCETIEKNGIAICSDKSVYSGWDSVTNYLRVNNQTKQPFVNLAPYVKKSGFKIKSAKKLKQDVVVKKEQRYLKSTSTKTKSYIATSTGQRITTTTVVKNYDTRTVTTTQDRWVDLKLSKSNQRNYKIPPGKAKGIHKKNAEYSPHNQTKVFTDGVEYLKLKLSVPPRQSQLPYLIKAFNSQGFAYLDPTVDSTWDGRFDITASSSYAGTHTDFPLYYNGNNRPADCADEGIRVTTSSKTGSEVLDMETVATGTAGSWEIYFKDPSASAGETYYVWCKNGGTSYSTSSVWADKYSLVNHLDNTSGSSTDSTANNNDGSFQGNLPNVVDGKLGSGQKFDGSGDAIHIPDDNSLDATSTITLMGWGRASSTQKQRILAKDDDNNGRSWSLRWDSDGDFRFELNTNSFSTAQGGSYATGIWNHQAGTYNKNDSNGPLEVYDDGNLAASKSQSGDINVSAAIVTIGKRNYAGAEDYFDGVIDEIRFIKTEEEAGWISDQYEMQNNNANFWTVGTWQATGGGAAAPARRNNTIID